jgi:ABC-type antimicrobial peptide transport system permease subunit
MSKRLSLAYTILTVSVLQVARNGKKRPSADWHALLQNSF